MTVCEPPAVVNVIEFTSATITTSTIHCQKSKNRYNKSNISERNLREIFKPERNEAPLLAVAMNAAAETSVTSISLILSSPALLSNMTPLLPEAIVLCLISIVIGPKTGPVAFCNIT